RVPDGHGSSRIRRVGDLRKGRVGRSGDEAARSVARSSGCGRQGLETDHGRGDQRDVGSAVVIAAGVSTRWNGSLGKNCGGKSKNRAQHDERTHTTSWEYCLARVSAVQMPAGGARQAENWPRLAAEFGFSGCGAK